MRAKRILGLLTLCAMTLALGACGGGSSSGGGGGPSIPTIRYTANGGDATAGAGTNGGNAGVVNFIAAGDVLYDDDRSRPTIANNFLTASVLDDNVVTYAELVAIDPGSTTIVAGVSATIDIALGVNLPSNATLDLSDATVDQVTINTSGNVVISGSILLTRSTADAVNLSIVSSSTSVTAMVYTGSLDGRGSISRDGGAFLLQTTNTNSGIIALGTANVSGGPGDGASDGGDGGSFVVNSAGDLILRNFGVNVMGGEGNAAGGNGGFFQINGSGEIQAPINWGGNASGGHGGTGNGGNGGTMLLFFADGDTSASSRLISLGGDSVGGNGGTGGQLQVGLVSAVLTGKLTGRVRANSDGGNATAGAGNGGFGNFVYLYAAEMDGFQANLTTRGGNSENGNGGSANQIGLIVNQAVNTKLDMDANGGNGGVNGGNGGFPLMLSSAPVAPVVYDGLRFNATANGGNGTTGNGGTGGQLYVGRSSIPAGTEHFTLVDGRVDFTANGGASLDGGNGGNGGILFVQHQTGSMEVTAKFSLNGGNSADGSSAGNGGSFRARMREGLIDATVSSGSTANGGNGTGGADGGDGGAILLEPDVALGEGTAIARISGVNLRGGNAENGEGGSGGQFTAYSGDGTNDELTISTLNVDARGGSSQTDDGGNGGGVGLYGLCPVNVNGGSINISGGNGGTSSGNADGGSAGLADMVTSDFALNFGASVTGNGGNGRGTGDGGNGGTVQADINANGSSAAGTFTLTGSLTLNGGNAPGSGEGGNGGGLFVGHSIATTGGSATLSSSITANGGTSGTDDGGNGGGVGIYVRSAVMLSGTVNLNGGTGDEAGNGGFYEVSNEGPLTVNGTINAHGANGQTSGGDGGEINLGNDNASSLTVNGSARLRANGGSGVSNGDAGIIRLDPEGAAGLNVTINGSPVFQTLDGAGVDQSATNVIQD